MDADRTPTWVFEDRHCCRAWLCNLIAVWRVWSGEYCYDHVIRAGWLPGAVQRPGDQLVIQ